MKQLLSIGLLVTVFTASYALNAKNYQIEAIKGEEFTL